MSRASLLLYLDSSAIVKLIAREKESAALADLVRSGGPAVASALATVEVHRAVRRLKHSGHLKQRTADVLDRIALIKMDDSILREAAQLDPEGLRSSEAIHLATALSIRQHLEAFVVYDERLARAAESLDLEVLSPV